MQRVTGRCGPADLAATLSKVNDDAPVILLTHEPDIFREVSSRVVFTPLGHTHCGQIRVASWLPLRLRNSAIALTFGHVVENCHDLSASDGLGTSLIPV